MDYLKLWNEYPSYCATAFKAGLGDSINPCVLASVLLFIVYISFQGKSKRRIFFLGLLYILASVRMQQMIIAGFWDGLLMNSVVQRLISIVYFCIAVGFIVLSALHFLDWQSSRFGYDKRRLWLNGPAFLHARKDTALKPGIRCAIQLVFAAISAYLISAVFTLIAAIYPQTEYIYIVHSFGVSGGDRNLVKGMFFYYSVAMALPVIVVWVVLMLGKLFSNGRTNIQVFYNGVMASLFCSGGLGLMYFVLRNVLAQRT